MTLISRLTHIALALWIGAVACVAALVAPAAFEHLDVAAAGELLAPIFRGVDIFGLATATVLVLSSVGWRRKVAVVMGVCAAASVFYLAGRIDGRNAYHYAAEVAWTVILLGGVALLWATARSAR